MIGAHHSTAQRRGWLGVALRWTAGVAVLLLLAHFFPLASLRAALARVPLWEFLVVLFAYLLAHSVGILKWRMVVNSTGAGLDLRTSAQCYTGGLFGTLFLPSIIGGDVVRLAVGLRRSSRPAAVLAGNVADRFLDAAAQAALVLAGLILLPGTMQGAWQLVAKKTVGIAALVALAVVIVGALLPRLLLRGRSFRFRRWLARLKHALHAVSRRPQILLFAWILGVLVQASLLMLTVRLAVSCGLDLPLDAWLFAWPLAKLAAMLPLTQGGVGVREAALVVLLMPFGAPGSLVLAAGLAWEGVIIAGGLASGLVALLLRRFEISKPLIR